MPFRVFVAILIVAVLAPACRRVESVAAVHAAGRDVVLAADQTVVSARVASGATFASLLREQGLASGGSGRMVHLRHANGFESEYLHLSAITVHAGARVHQGELIGRVGSTGLATGPHLDYRLKKKRRVHQSADGASRDASGGSGAGGANGGVQ
jgi:murein DD-endopeptidase MepM/ murein hydrolase activator NlpD